MQDSLLPKGIPQNQLSSFPIDNQTPNNGQFQQQQEQFHNKQHPQAQTDALLSYIADLKKVATSNKSKRSGNPNASSSSNLKNKKQNKQGNMQQIYNQQQLMPVKTPTSNNFFRNSAMALSSDEEGKRQLMSPTGGNQQMYLSSADDQAQQIQSDYMKQPKHMATNNIANKAFQLLASKRAASVLKGYDESFKNLSFSGNISTTHQQTQVLTQPATGQGSSTNQSKSSYLKPPPNLCQSNIQLGDHTPSQGQISVPRNLSGYGNLFKIPSTPNKQQQALNRSSQKNLSNNLNQSATPNSIYTNQQPQLLTNFTPTSMLGMQGPSASTAKGKKKFMEDILRNAKRSSSKLQGSSQRKSERSEKNIIIRKNSSKSLLKDLKDHQQVQNLNQTQQIISNQGNGPVISNEFILIENQVRPATNNNNTNNNSNSTNSFQPQNFNNTQVIFPSQIDTNSKNEESKSPPKKRVIDRKKIVQARSQSSHQSQFQNQGVAIQRQHFKVVQNYSQQMNAEKVTQKNGVYTSENMIVTESTDNTEFRHRPQQLMLNSGVSNQLQEGGEEGAGIDGNTEQNKRYSSSGNPSGGRKQYGYTIGNSLGKKTLNMSQHYDSSLYELNMSLGKNGVNHLNLTSLLKQNILEDDGIEDLHFYQVAFNKHREKLLKTKEQKAMIEQMKKEMYDRGEIDCEEDLCKQKTQKKEMSETERVITKQKKSGNNDDTARLSPNNNIDSKTEEKNLNRTIESIDDDFEIF